jgi:hypothetical protein
VEITIMEIFRVEQVTFQLLRSTYT